VLKAVSYQQHIDVAVVWYWTTLYLFCHRERQALHLMPKFIPSQYVPCSSAQSVWVQASLLRHCFANKQLSSGQIAAVPDGAPLVLKQTAAGQPSSFELELIDTCFSPPCAPNTIQPMNGQTFHVSTADKAWVAAKQSANPEPNSVKLQEA